MTESGPLATAILGLSSEASVIRNFIQQAARSPAPVTLLGEPGTGKQLVALSIHEASCRSKAPFLMIDCSLYYERELKRELFGFGGAGAIGESARKGMLEFASRGTCYLSHIEELTPSVQASLARFLQGGRFHRLGDGREVSSGVRLMVSSDKNLEGFVRAGLFDPALYAQLSRLSIRLPPLRERKQDIPVIVDSLRLEFAGSSGFAAAPEFVSETMRALEAYPWPLNFDELRKEVKRLLESGCRRVSPDHLATEIASYWGGHCGDPQVRRVVEELESYIREFRILSQLDCEFGSLLEVLVTGEEEVRNCYWNLMEEF